MAGRGRVGALGVEVDEAPGVRAAFGADLGLTAVAAAGEVLPGGDAGGLQCGEGAGEPFGIGLALPGGLLRDALAPESVGEFPRLRRGDGPAVLGDQVVLGELGRSPLSVSTVIAANGSTLAQPSDMRPGRRPAAPAAAGGCRTRGLGCGACRH